jgi:hypothetical protein
VGIVNAYRETLNRWAQQHIPDGAHVVKVDITYDDGWEPTFTDRPESLHVSIAYTFPILPSHSLWTEITLEQLTTVGDLLTQLFAIEDKP